MRITTFQDTGYAIASQRQQPLLTIENVTKIYPTKKGANVVLEGVNLTVEAGEFICVIGHSGCGKSTLLNMVAGFTQPTSGEVRLKGQVIKKPGPDRMVVFQNYSLLPWLTVRDNVALAVDEVLGKLPAKEREDLIRHYIHLVGLDHALDKFPAQLSGGMKQRVAIARALAVRPELLILDEPFGALDAITKEELQEELLKIWWEQKCTVLMITHDIDEALFLSDRLVLMTNGPAAKIGEILTIPFEHPRDRDHILEDPQYYDLRNYVLDYLFGRMSHEE
jgi:bicarbonate transport system ATP-binding protein